MSVTLTGPWEQVISNLRTGKIFRPARTAAQLLILADEISKEAERRIKKGPPPKLAESTKIRKRRGKFRPFTKPWRETQWTINNLFDEPQIIKTRGQLDVRIRLSKVKHPTSDVPTDRVVAWLEFGTSTQKKRPVIQPLLMEVRSGKLPFVERFFSRYSKSLSLV